MILSKKGFLPSDREVTAMRLKEVLKEFCTFYIKSCVNTGCADELELTENKQTLQQQGIVLVQY